VWPELPEKITVSDEKIGDEPNWGPMKIRIYQPESSTPLPLMVYFHGGGFFAGNLETEDAHCRYFAAKTPCVLMSIDYPLAPPSLIDLIIEAGIRSVEWSRANASKYNADASKTILCGGSAGAWMSSMIAYHYTQEKKDSSVIAGCILMFAVAAHAGYDGAYKNKYTAWAEHGNNKVPIITTELINTIWPAQGFDFKSPRHFQLFAESLKGFPPCYLVSAEKDCVRDDAICLEMLLKKDGVPTKLDFYPGLPHYFHAFPQLAVTHEMMAKSVEGVKFVLAA
jgi:versiconal hemiacetal acetate esterase